MRYYIDFQEVQGKDGFFHRFSIEFFEKLVELFPNITAGDIETMDGVLSRYGDRLLMRQYADMYRNGGETTEAAAKVMTLLTHEVCLVCFDKWKNTRDLYAVKYDAEMPLKRVKTITEDRDNTRDEKTRNNVFAYDSDTESGKDTSTFNGEGAEKMERRETTEYSNGNTPDVNARGMIDFYRDNRYIEDMCRDIAEYCTLDIF